LNTFHWSFSHLHLWSSSACKGAKFPAHFKREVSSIFKRLIRLYGHIYYSHFDTCKELGAEAHLNTCFKHLMYFILCHDLVEAREMEPVQRLIDKFMKEDEERKAASASAAASFSIGGSFSSSSSSSGSGPASPSASFSAS
jgi:hypothetical protein